MMKNKNITIVLLLLSIGIWGTIGWKVYSSLTESPLPVSRIAKIVAPTDKDSIRLLLNYRDPFLEDDDAGVEISPDSTLTLLPIVDNTMPVQTPIEMQLQMIQYKGCIRSGKQTKAIVAHNGAYLMLNEHDTIGEFVVVSITEDELTISHAGDYYHLETE